MSTEAKTERCVTVYFSDGDLQHRRGMCKQRAVEDIVYVLKKLLDELATGEKERVGMKIDIVRRDDE